jgi:3-hydroxyisobutyrate dehydrogenase-like beta-hydroxyacid dehydrogenase
MMTDALTLYRRLIAEGHSELDTSAIFKLYDGRSI